MTLAHTHSTNIFLGVNLCAGVFVGNQKIIILNFLFNLMHVNVLATFQRGQCVRLGYFAVRTGCVSVCLCVFCGACVLCMLGARAELPTPIQNTQRRMQIQKLFVVLGLTALISSLRIIQLTWLD